MIATQLAQFFERGYMGILHHMNTTQYDCIRMVLDASGKLYSEPDNEWECDCTVTQLLNGRIRYEIRPKDTTHNWHEFIKSTPSFTLRAESQNERSIFADGIRFTHTKYSIGDDTCILFGSSSSVEISRQQEGQFKSGDIIHEVTNLYFTGRLVPFTIKIDDLSIEIGTLVNHEQRKTNEHGRAYQHAVVSAYLKIKNVTSAEIEDVNQCINILLRLVSFARRSNVFVAATSYEDKEWVKCIFEEPVFVERGWPRPLVQDSDLDEFLKATYPSALEKFSQHNLGNIFDHYLQALTIRSAWPMSLGIFTAMEGLKSSFSREHKSNFDTRVVDHKEFRCSTEMFAEIKQVLTNHFPQFQTLVENDDTYLQTQIERINERPTTYREQLERMLDVLGVQYAKEEISPFIKIRNSIIHTANPIRQKASTKANDGSLTSAWNDVLSAGSLFERIMLAYLGYSGPCELLDSHKRHQL